MIPDLFYLGCRAFLTNVQLVVDHFGSFTIFVLPFVGRLLTI